MSRILLCSKRLIILVRNLFHDSFAVFRLPSEVCRALSYISPTKVKACLISSSPLNMYLYFMSKSTRHRKDSRKDEGSKSSRSDIFWVFFLHQTTFAFVASTVYFTAIRKEHPLKLNIYTRSFLCILNGKIKSKNFMPYRTQ